MVKRRPDVKKIAGPSKPISYFVGGFDLDITEGEICQNQKDDSGLVIMNIELNKRNKYNKSFKIDIDVSQREIAKNPDTWY